MSITYLIVAFVAGLSVVVAVAAFVWGWATRQFTGATLGALPLDGLDDGDEAAADIAVEDAPVGRLRSAIFTAVLAAVFGTIGWLIYTTITVAAQVPPGR